MKNKLLWAIPALSFLAFGIVLGYYLANREDGFDDRARAWLLSNPEILLEATNILQQRQETAATEYDTALISEFAAPLFNGPDGYIGTGEAVAVEFFDYQCGFCKRQAPIVKAYADANPGRKIIFKEFPILGAPSELAARAAIAVRMLAGNDSYVEFHNALMEHRGAINATVIDQLLADAGHDLTAIRAQMNAEAITKEIEANRNLASRLRINGTPGMVFRDSIARGLLDAGELVARIGDG